MSNHCTNWNTNVHCKEASLGLKAQKKRHHPHICDPTKTCGIPDVVMTVMTAPDYPERQQIGKSLMVLH